MNFPQSNIRAVIDTNVVFEGLTRRAGSTSAVIDAWLGGLFQPCISNALVYEYTDVLSRKLSKVRWAQLIPILDRLIDQSVFITTHFSWRPSSPDSADEHLIDCAMNARAIVVTSNLRDFQGARDRLGLPVLLPVEFVKLLVEMAGVPSEE